KQALLRRRGEIHPRGHQGVGKHHPVCTDLDALHPQEKRREVTRVPALQPEVVAPVRGAARAGARVTVGTGGTRIASALRGALLLVLRRRPVPTAAAGRANTAGNEHLHHPAVHWFPPYPSPWSLS